MKIIKQINRHLDDSFPVYLAIAIGIGMLFGAMQEQKNTKVEYLNLCNLSGKSQIECQMRWIEINR